MGAPVPPVAMHSVPAERMLSLLALPELAAGACISGPSSVSEAGMDSTSEARVLLLSLDILAGCWTAFANCVSSQSLPFALLPTV